MVRPPRQPNIPSIFGESPVPDPEPRQGFRAEITGTLRALIIATGTFIALALFIILLGQFPTEPKLVNFPGQGDWEVPAAEDEAFLNSYGWVNQESGVVHIPIKDAMKLVEQRGLPARQSAPVAEGVTEVPSTTEMTATAAATAEATSEATTETTAEATSEVTTAATAAATAEATSEATTETTAEATSEATTAATAAATAEATSEATTAATATP